LGASRISAAFPAEPPHNCVLCPRLASFIAIQRAIEPLWHNGPVPSSGCETARLLIVGLAPGLKGGNRTGRAFTGDSAGELLYATLAEFGFAKRTFAAPRGDGVVLIDTMITNAVRCVPPGNQPTPAEIGACRRFLTARIAALPKLEAIVALGRIAHTSTLTALGVKPKDALFSHGARHQVRSGLVVFDSYHCSRYNTSTGVLTPEMFRAVFASVRASLGPATRS
jgi:uracil-DNA glycosylase